MTESHSLDPQPRGDHLGIPALDDLPAASSLMSSRWSRDNLISSHPARLYHGKILQRIGAAELEGLVRHLEASHGAAALGAARMGMFTWDVSCKGKAGPFVLQVPLVLDEEGTRGRSRAAVPWLNFAHLQAFRARGLDRFLVEPQDRLTLDGNVKAATFAALPEHHRLTFANGELRVELAEGKVSWLVSLGPQVTADLLAEMLAALVYHYEPDREGGTIIADVTVNDGDFVVKRRPDGSYDLRLTAVRRLETGIGPHLFLLYLVQMMAFEEWTVDGELIGLPVLMSNPSVAFEAVARGLRYRFEDLGRTAEEADAEARRWIHDFGRSRDGRAYRPWVERFLGGGLPPRFGAASVAGLGADLRERWWRLTPLQTRLGFLELRARKEPESAEAKSAAAVAQGLRVLLDRLSREIGRIPADDAVHPSATPAVRLNDLSREGLLALFEEADMRVASDVRVRVVDQLLAHWPYRSLDQLLTAVPGARPLRRSEANLSFGRIVAERDQGTLRSLGAPPTADKVNKAGAPGKNAKAQPLRPLANNEVYGGLTLPASLHATAVATFLTFEAFMDEALHAPAWGYYAQSVTIGRTGHFNTNPEEQSPHYGGWMATWAYRFWCDMVARGELAQTEAFPVIEFGAGNGRLARDILDAVALRARAAISDSSASTTGETARWQTFASRLDYRIYETSEGLREKQRRLLGERAQVAAGDARHPSATLARDFPDGVKGLVLTNEVPDAFGVHKVVLTTEGRALAALVVPRVEASLREAVSEELAAAMAEANARVRRTFGWTANSGDFYLDAPTYAALREELARLPVAEQTGMLNALWFEEAYVPAAILTEVGTHLRANAAQYALALAAEDSGVVTYINVHADRFVRELGTSLKAGFIVTVDYGDTIFRLVKGARRGDFPFRVYGDWSQDHIPRPNDPYTAPGMQDMTTDVNFTALARAGEAAGLHVVHFGPERDVTGDALPEVLHGIAEESSLAEFVGNPVFKVLVLGTRASDVFTGPLLSPLPLVAREQDIPAARRAKLAAIEKALVTPEPAASETSPPGQG